MDRVKNILFVSRAHDDEADALRQTLQLAADLGARLTVLVHHPALPAELDDQLQPFEDYLRSRVLALCGGGAEVAIEGGPRPALAVLRRVQRDAHDLVVKLAEPRTGGKGFRALDMELLRKCPCPVWLCHPGAGSAPPARVAVAVDALIPSVEGRALSLRLLRIGEALARRGGHTLAVISCWDCAYEDFLRYSALAHVSDERIASAVAHERSSHRTALDALIAQARLDMPPALLVSRGLPEQEIPRLAADHGTDLLVMGTVARTGIRGLVIGNTAENVVQEIGCSLLALKPEGFVPPMPAS